MKHVTEIHSLNIDDLNVAELERRLEMAIASTETEAEKICGVNHECNCGALTGCTTFCK